MYSASSDKSKLKRMLKESKKMIGMELFAK